MASFIELMNSLLMAIIIKKKMTVLPAELSNPKKAPRANALPVNISSSKGLISRDTRNP